MINAIGIMETGWRNVYFRGHDVGLAYHQERIVAEPASDPVPVKPVPEVTGSCQHRSIRRCDKGGFIDVFV
jgi:hypothetical protein